MTNGRMCNNFTVKSLLITGVAVCSLAVTKVSSTAEELIGIMMILSDLKGTLCFIKST